MGIKPRSIRNHFEDRLLIDSGSFQARFGVDSRSLGFDSIRAPLGIDSGSIRDQFGIQLGFRLDSVSIRNQFRVHLGSIRLNFGIISGSTGVQFSRQKPTAIHFPWGAAAPQFKMMWTFFFLKWGVWGPEAPVATKTLQTGSYLFYKFSILFFQRRQV